MNTPISVIPSKRRVRRKRRNVGGPTSVAPLVLVSASFDAGDFTLTLAFDRAIDVAGIDPSQLTVLDEPATGNALAGSAVASQPTPASVVLDMVVTGAAEGPTVLNATAETGIVAANDGAAWAGVAGLALPYP